MLAIIQGLTEFLPVSSSGHLVLFHTLSGENLDIWDDSLALDIAVHIGTLLSVIIYFRDDVMQMMSETYHGVFTKTSLEKTPLHTCLSFQIILASLPIIIAGFLLFTIKPDFLRSIEVMAWMTLIFGLVLGYADKAKPSTRTIESLRLKDALFIGMFQVLSLIPGVSRSGITMTAGRFKHFHAADSAKFSLFLSMIAIAGAGVLAGIDVYQAHNTALGITVLLAIAVSFVCGYVSIGLMMRWLDRHGFMPFVIYRVVLGVILLALVYGGIVPA